jgi:hypothetical protein
MGDIGIVKSLTNNLKRIAALPREQWPDDPRFAELAPRDDEDAVAYQSRARDVIGSWWGYTGASLRAYENVRRTEPMDHPPESERWPKDSAQFLRDLQRYGGVKFTGKNGSEKLVPSSLGKGMDPFTYTEIARRTGGGSAERSLTAEGKKAVARRRALSRPKRTARA